MALSMSYCHDPLAWNSPIFFRLFFCSNSTFGVWESILKVQQIPDFCQVLSSLEELKIGERSSD